MLLQLFKKLRRSLIYENLKVLKNILSTLMFSRANCWVFWEMTFLETGFV